VHAFVHAVDLDMDVRDAVDTPRTYCQGDELFVDARVGSAVQGRLADRGHRVVAEETIPGYAPFARVSAVMAQDGGLTSASDPPYSGGAGGC